MAKRMLIDANHPEETRVVVLSGKRLEEFDYETAARSQLKGNIYLAKITRVEPSLQAAFVEYGGNRHGFLPFSEIHPDYYKIPIADREALAAEEAALRNDSLGEDDIDAPDNEADKEAGDGADNGGADDSADGEANGEDRAAETAGIALEDLDDDPRDDPRDDPFDAAEDQANRVEQVDVEPRVDTLGGDEIEEQRRRRASLLRRYKIQEVIKRRQVILVQVAKEERGTKGAALTTYLSLAGRYCVLMPNTARGGGISRKIGSANDRRRLKSILGELEIPDGMAVIVRTAGSQRSKAEIRRDYEYLMRLWDEIRQTTLRSTAPCLIHEEANLIKRSIRDLYSRDMDEVWVQGEAGYKTAKAFMRSLMPSHAKKVQQYKDQSTPIFHHHQVEGQLEAMHRPTVQLKSGGYIVINQTEALVAIDVNSGRATRERHIEETALKTNREAAEEVARQLRLRDLAGLVVVDFIDMEDPRHNREVERRLKEAMRSDRARIQLGRVSPFGLLELSRQRLRPSLFESSTELCPRCGGTGHVRSVYSSALAVLRSLEEEGLRGRESDLRVAVPTAVALYLLNEFRNRVIEVEQRYGFKITVEADDELLSDDFRLDRTAPAAAPASEAAADEEDAGRKRRRGRRRRKGGEEELAAEETRPAEPESAAEEDDGSEGREEARDAAGESDDGRKGRRRRGRRGGRRRARRRPEAPEAQEAPDALAAMDGARRDAPAEGAAEAAPTAGDESGPGAAVGGEDGAAETLSEAPAEGREDAAREAPPTGRRGRPRKSGAKPTAAKDAGPHEAAAGGEPGDEKTAESEAGKGAARGRRSPAKRARRPRGERQPRRSEADAAAAPETSDSGRPSTSGPEGESGGPERVEAPEGPGQRDLPAAAASPAGAPEPGPQKNGPENGPENGPGSGSGSGPNGDVSDLPKRRGWWNRWV